jgi:hypothetical protein
MPFTQLTVHRHDRRKRALVTLVGEIDLTSAPLVRTTPAEFLLLGVPLGYLLPPVEGVPDPAAHAPPHRTVPLASLLSGDAR